MLKPSVLNLTKMHSFRLFFSLQENDRVQDDIHHFISPLEKVHKLDTTAVAPLIELLKADLGEIKLGSLSLRSVLMALRLLKHLITDEKAEKYEGKKFSWW